LPGWLDLRRRNARMMDAALAGVPGLRIHVPPEAYGHSYYKYYAFIEPERLVPGWTQQRIIDAINREGIPCIAGSCSEMYLEKAFTDAGIGPAARFPNARRLGETSLMFMVHPTLAERDVHDTCNAIAKVMAVAAGAQP
jgi:dTDP-4-amino-4,6-dideoxygalactose transaminase